MLGFEILQLQLEMIKDVPYDILLCLYDATFRVLSSKRMSSYSNLQISVLWRTLFWLRCLIDLYNLHPNFILYYMLVRILALYCIWLVMGEATQGS